MMIQTFLCVRVLFTALISASELNIHMLGPLPLVTSAPLVSVLNPHPCAYRLELSCASSVRVFEFYLVLPY